MHVSGERNPAPEPARRRPSAPVHRIDDKHQRSTCGLVHARIRHAAPPQATSPAPTSCRSWSACHCVEAAAPLAPLQGASARSVQPAQVRRRGRAPALRGPRRHPRGRRGIGLGSCAGPGVTHEDMQVARVLGRAGGLAGAALRVRFRALPRRRRRLVHRPRVAAARRRRARRAALALLRMRRLPKRGAPIGPKWAVRRARPAARCLARAWQCGVRLATHGWQGGQARAPCALPRLPATWTPERPRRQGARRACRQPCGGSPAPAGPPGALFAWSLGRRCHRRTRERARSVAALCRRAGAPRGAPARHRRTRPRARGRAGPAPPSGSPR